MAGTRYAKIPDSAAQALAFPRNHIAELKNRPELHRQAVYFLLGVDTVSGRDAVYVGEARVITKQFIEHLAKKDFWSECIVCPTPGDTFPLSHIKYLQSIFVAGAHADGDYHVLNSAPAKEPALGQAERDAMDEYVGNVKALLAAFARPVLESSQVRSRIAPGSVSTSNLDVNVPTDAERLQLRVSGIMASGLRAAGGALLVLKRSHANKQVELSLSNGNLGVRSMLIRTGVLVDAGDHFQFVRDYTFTSPTQAASVILGYNANGRQMWRVGDGRSLGEIDRHRQRVA